MKRLLITTSERGKISYVPNKNIFGRREPVTIQILPPLHSVMINNYVNVNNEAPSTPISFWPKKKDSLSARLEYVQEELVKLQQERTMERCREFNRFAYYSKESDKDIEPYLELTTVLYHDNDVELGEGAIPYGMQQRDMGSLNAYHSSNVRLHDTLEDTDTDKSRPKMKSTHSRWSE